MSVRPTETAPFGCRHHSGAPIPASPRAWISASCAAVPAGTRGVPGARAPRPRASSDSTPANGTALGFGERGAQPLDQLVPAVGVGVHGDPPYVGAAFGEHTGHGVGPGVLGGRGDDEPAAGQPRGLLRRRAAST
ncbi:hypothetical protein [Streptomyces sp. Mo3]|uniref:hypothetical protein n=1 Tax=Streptomyces sp. Mo3 TaxID=3161190 RepID=UPI0039F008A3